MPMRRVFLLSPRTNQLEATDWVERVRSNGGNVDAATFAAVNQYVADLKSAGVWDLVVYDLRLCGSDLAAARTPLKRTAGNAIATNVGFVAGDYSNSTGLAGNGSTKYLRTGVVPGTALGTNDRHFSAYELAKAGGTLQTTLGADGDGTNPNVNNWQMGVDTPDTAYRLLASADGTVANFSNGYTGSAQWIAVGSNPQAFYKNGAAQTPASPPAFTGGNQEVYIFGYNRNGGVLRPSSVRLGGVTIGKSLTAAQALALYNADLRFQQALGRA